MKKIGIITINDNNNYGNRLQNYATQEILKKLNIDVITLKNRPGMNFKEKFIKGYIKKFLSEVKFFIKKKKEREKCFLAFNRNVRFSKFYVTPFSNIKDKYDYFLVGSDQVWNPTMGRLSEVDLLNFADNKQKIAFSASFGISELPQNINKTVVKNSLKSFDAISVREDAGKSIVEELTERKDVEVLIDPTMLLLAEEWDKVSRKPKQLDSLKTSKYILNYFLGELSEKRKNEINRIAKENNCEVINILDKNSPFYQTGPGEFLYLEKNAFLICTDSFHSSVFAILYNRPFIIFDREDSHVCMNSRIETLINKLQLKNRKFNDKITPENINHDYKMAYSILEKEREKSMQFLKKTLEI
ncbi:MAG: polysaccharide pyruvyl transferase family protein [Clostridia bacterium]|nr:polysaccharide pyruvyl transferase family protein [Clostridia bacterium]